MRPRTGLRPQTLLKKRLQHRLILGTLFCRTPAVAVSTCKNIEYGQKRAQAKFINISKFPLRTLIFLPLILFKKELRDSIKKFTLSCLV